MPRSVLTNHSRDATPSRLVKKDLVAATWPHWEDTYVLPNSGYLLIQMLEGNGHGTRGIPATHMEDSD